MSVNCVTIYYMLEFYSFSDGGEKILTLLGVAQYE
jgi:hypothetical protein